MKALVSQLAEETDSKPVQCEFESHRGHSRYRDEVDAVDHSPEPPPSPPLRLSLPPSEPAFGLSADFSSLEPALVELALVELVPVEPVLFDVDLAGFAGVATAASAFVTVGAPVAAFGSSRSAFDGSAVDVPVALLTVSVASAIDSLTSIGAGSCELACATSGSGALG